mmetsp:Transcript_24405/g.59219  ORF Transcript_24405/g.59219 Transcript_24405/m.59219 type:complete len:384 (-) Transcript_24405:92-1243(-)
MRLFALLIPMAVTGSDVATPIAAIQKQLATLEVAVKKSGKVTPGVYKNVQRLLRMVEDVIEPAIIKAHAADHTLGELRLKAVRDISPDFKAVADAAGKTQDQLDVAVNSTLAVEANTSVSTAHTMCDSAELAAKTATNAIADMQKRRYYYSELSRAFVECDLHSSDASTCWQNTLALVVEFNGTFIQLAQDYEEAKEFHRSAESKATQSEHDCITQCDKANELLQQYNSSVTKHNDTCQDAPGKYRKSYNDVLGRYNTSVANFKSATLDIAERVKDRKNEWTSTQTIKCMLQHYCVTGQLEVARIESCKGGINTTFLNLTWGPPPPPPPPPIINCTEVAPLPALICNKTTPIPNPDPPVPDPPEPCTVIETHTGVGPEWCAAY